MNNHFSQNAKHLFQDTVYLMICLINVGTNESLHQQHL